MARAPVADWVKSSSSEEERSRSESASASDWASALVLAFVLGSVAEPGVVVVAGAVGLEDLDGLEEEEDGRREER